MQTHRKRVKPPDAARVPSPDETQRRLDDLLQRMDDLERKIGQLRDAAP